MIDFQVAMVRMVTSLAIGVVQTLLGIRFVLKILGANPQAPFVAWVYDNTQVLLYPFQGIFPTPSIVKLFTIEFSTLFAMVVYTIVGYLIFEFVNALERSTQEKHRRER